MDYRMRRVTFHTKYTYEVTYDDRFTVSIGAYGSTQNALREANRMMDVYGFKKAEIVDAMTGEVVATVEEEEP